MKSRITFTTLLLAIALFTGCDDDSDPNINCIPGNACDDGNDNTINDQFDDDCYCVGVGPDVGCIHGDPCNDGDPNTIDDRYDNDCFCVGVPTTFTDIRDNQAYNLAVIGDQIWFAENLNYETEGSLCYDDDPDICITYGRLYDWETAQTVCPEGWRLPNDEDWLNLISTLDGEDVAGGKMKEAGTTHWEAPNNATNESGFTALPGGYSRNGNQFREIGRSGYWWSADEQNSSKGNYVELRNNKVSVDLHADRKENGMCVRCLQDR